jgi:hypothetical protein
LLAALDHRNVRFAPQAVTTEAVIARDGTLGFGEKISPRRSSSSV